MACVVMGYIAMAYVLMAYIGMACIVTAYIVMAEPKALQAKKSLTPADAERVRALMARMAGSNHQARAFISASPTARPLHVYRRACAPWLDSPVREP